MSSVNKHGLSRYIPNDIKRIIRQNSKFACVVPHCRNAFYEYEHIDPEFKDAQSHDPSKICLVCPNHNPRKQGKARQENYSKEQLADFYKNLQESDGKIAPRAKNFDFFNGFEAPPKIIVGESVFENVQSIININGEDVFSFEVSKDKNPFVPDIMFSGHFQNHNGETLFEIRANEWISPVYHWDIETSNGEIVIYDAEKREIFRARKKPEENAIEIISLYMWFPPFLVEIDEGKFTVTRLSADRKTYIGLQVDCTFLHGACGVYLDQTELFDSPGYAGWVTRGGEGMSLVGNGIWFGRGCEGMFLRNVGIIRSKDLPTILVFEGQKLFGNQKTEVPPSGANYFVVGKVQVERIRYPKWEEKRYILNGHELKSEPYSWGRIDDDGQHLYHISSNEPADLATNPGFVGYYADDLLAQPWADKVFEVVVEDFDSEGQAYPRRVKKSDVQGRRILSEASTNRPMIPQQFAGFSAWK